MKMTVAGGCGEHGRNCFFVKGSNIAFIVDCGLMPGAEMPYPYLSKAEIQAAEWLFITHSHLDHTGAYPWFCDQGFSGCVVITSETAKQLSFAPKHVCLIDDMIPAMSPGLLSEDLSVVWGRSGQCAGSVWYEIHSGDKSILFSGDYVEDTLAYRCDFIRDRKADTAVLDSAYGNAEQTPDAYRDALVDTLRVFLELGKKILFPVPKYGRGFDLLLLLNRNFPSVPFKVDEHLYGELSRIADMGDWVKPEAIAEIKRISNIEGMTESGESGFVFLSDPQLKSFEAQKLANDAAENNDGIILTGHADKGSFSEQLIESGRAVLKRYAVHMSDNERMGLEKLNRFEAVVPYHR